MVALLSEVGASAYGSVLKSSFSAISDSIFESGPWEYVSGRLSYLMGTEFGFLIIRGELPSGF